jgi:hypothetical protein
VVVDEIVADIDLAEFDDNEDEHDEEDDDDGFEDNDE